MNPGQPRTRAAILLLVVQLAVVCSIAGKYLYERHTRPRVWVQVTQYDPDQPLRGRYLSLQLLVDSCALPHTPDNHHLSFYPHRPFNEREGGWTWNVTLAAHNGKLTPAIAPEGAAYDEHSRLTIPDSEPCRQALVIDSNTTLLYFIPDTARTPFPLPKDTTLWAEVTVPAEGPPRPIQLALSGPNGFHLLDLH